MVLKYCKLNGILNAEDRRCYHMGPSWVNVGFKHILLGNAVLVVDRVIAYRLA